MFEVLVNLLLTSLFLQSQANQQATISNLTAQEYRLPQAEVRRLEEVAPQPVAKSESVGVKVTAQSVLVIDKETNKILYQKNPKAVRSIASITKLMTALVFLDRNPGWDKTVKIMGSDYQEGGITYLIAGEEITVKDIFYATLVASSNEAAAVLAKSTGLSSAEFVQAMNDRAKALGMDDTLFSDVSGLDPDNRSTVADIAILIRAAFNRPEIFDAAGTKEYGVSVLNKAVKRKIISTDKILNQAFGVADNRYRVEAGKTGYLEKAGYCFASQVSDQGNNKILVVVLGSATINDRFGDTKSLAYWTFNNYRWQ